MVDFPCYTPPSLATDIPACANWLYDKHTVTVLPSLPVGQDDVGGQVDTFGTAYTLKCNMQTTNVEPTNFTPGPRTGKLYTRNLSGVKTRDVVVDADGVRWRVGGTEIPKNHVNREPHHLEADIEVISSSVELESP